MIIQIDDTVIWYLPRTTSAISYIYMLFYIYKAKHTACVYIYDVHCYQTIENFVECHSQGPTN